MKPILRASFLLLLSAFHFPLSAEEVPLIDGKDAVHMQYGPAICHSVVFTDPPDKNAARFEDATERAFLVDLPGPGVVCYDLDRLSVAAFWATDKKQPADFSKTHCTTYKGSNCLRPNGPLLHKDVDAAGWVVGREHRKIEGKDLSFEGYHLHGNKVLLKYRIGGRAVEEVPSARGKQQTLWSRSFRVGPGTLPLSVLLGKEGATRVTLSGDAKTWKVRTANGKLWLDVPVSKKPLSFTASLAFGGKESPPASSPPDFDNLAKAGPLQWTHVVTTKATLGKPKNGYALDLLAAPLKNPWGCRMRTTCLDFFPDGSLAAGTMNGDVWLVRWPDDFTKVEWRRFATGLYEPLGLKIVDGKIYLRGRDRITRLHDLNGDGQADFYEDFYHEGEVGPGYHAFIFDLVTDKAGNFYYTKSGRKAPYKGGVVKLSPDGKSHEFVCTDFRHPNGLGAGGPQDWITVADNPAGKAVYDGFALVRKGGTHGYEKNRTAPMLCVLPPKVDSSSGSQTWTDPKRWGPLGGSIFHVSYSRCNLFYVMTQDLPPYPNAFAVKFPFSLASGSMRSRVNPRDGQIYVAAHKGWDSKAAIDGALYRIRYAGGTCRMVTRAEARKDAIRLVFGCPIDPELVEKESFAAAFEDKTGTKPIPVLDAKLVDERTVDVFLPALEKETLQARTRKDKKTGIVTYSIHPSIALYVDLEDLDGELIIETVYCTINSLPKD